MREPRTVYAFDPVTKIYIGEQDSYPDPMSETDYLLPADTAIIAPPAPAANTVYVWNGTAWDSIEDHRGTVIYSTADLKSETLKEVGPVPEGYTALDPSGTPFAKWNGSAWVTDTDAQSAAAAAALKASAQTALDKSDTTAIRCVKAGVDFPADWQTYVLALRAIIAGGPGPVPSHPAYPAGT